MTKGSEGRIKRVLVASIVLRLWKKAWPKAPLMLPPVLCGAIWTVGFCCATVGVSELGMAVGYVMTAVGPVGVSALCTHFLFKEIQGRDNQVKFWFAIVLQATGVLLDAGFRPGE